MKTKTYTEVVTEVTRLLDLMNKSIEAGAGAATFRIENVSLKNIIDTYHFMNRQGSDVKLRLPGEDFTGEYVEIQYRATANFYIFIQSEPCVNLTYKPLILN
jgi:hypothetical protein